MAGSGLGKHDAHQADVFGSRQRYLHGDADFAGVECDAFGDELGLRIARIVAESERGGRESASKARARCGFAWAGKTAL